MAKVIKTIEDCKECEYSTYFTSVNVDYSLVVCNKTRKLLLIVDKGTIDRHKIKIPDDCPLPDFVEPKTD